VVKVLDFGIAKVVRGERRVDALETQAGTVFGTPRYMSPEQAQSNPLDARSDLYSLGVIFYHMLTGHPPFEDSDAVVVMARHIKTKPRRPSDVRPDLDIPSRLEKLVLRLMEKDRNKRPQSSEELIEALNKIHEGQDEEFGALARPASSGPPSRRLFPILAAAGVSLVLAAGALIAFAVTRNDADADPLPQEQIAQLLSAPPPDEPQPDTTAQEPPQDENLVEVTLDSEPTGAVVIRNGRRLGPTPLMVSERLGASIAFVFELDGHETKTEVVTISRDDRSHLVILAPAGAAKARPVWTPGKARVKGRPHAEKPPPPPTAPVKPPPTPTKSRYGRFDNR